jgi:hypothetical protein
MNWNKWQVCLGLHRPLEYQPLLSQTTEMAQTILDLVVEGPESDLVYTAFQDADDHKSTTDDEEMEARLLDANDI